MIDFEKIPKQCLDKFNDIKNRVNDLISKYKSLANWGKPIFNDLIEIACVYYVNSKLNISLDKLAKWIGLDKTSLYKLIKRIDSNEKVSIYDRSTNTIVQINVTPVELINKVEELIQPRAKVVISDIFESAIIREFLSRQIEKRSKVKGKSMFLTERHKKETLSIISKLIEYFASNNKPTNPDVWTENEVYEAIIDMFKDPQQRYRAMVALRRIPQWGKWFEGKVGAVTKVINPVMRFITYRDYVKLKEAWKRGELTDSEFLVTWLHLTCGCREGWGAEGVSESTQLKDANTSLIGLKWSKLSYVSDTYILQIYESKTDKYWDCDLSWLDPEPIEVLLKYRGSSDSIIESITNTKTVKEFRQFYKDTLKKVSEILQLPFTLKPHDLRRSHLSILAELGVPLEVSCGGLLGFGVGWEDLKTAFIFYLRLSKHMKQRIMNEIRQRQKEISNT
ncbi:MAG: hypothetical protein QXW20_08450 [Ignisphaera sp.]